MQFSREILQSVLLFPASRGRVPVGPRSWASLRTDCKCSPASLRDGHVPHRTSVGLCCLRSSKRNRPHTYTHTYPIYYAHGMHSSNRKTRERTGNLKFWSRVERLSLVMTSSTFLPSSLRPLPWQRLNEKEGKEENGYFGARPYLRLGGALVLITGRYHPLQEGTTLPRWTRPQGMKEMKLPLLLQCSLSRPGF